MFALLGCYREINGRMNSLNTSLEGFGDKIQQNDEPNYRSPIQIQNHLHVRTTLCCALLGLTAEMGLVSA